MFVELDLILVFFRHHTENNSILVHGKLNAYLTENIYLTFYILKEY